MRSRKCPGEPRPENRAKEISGNWPDRWDWGLPLPRALPENLQQNLLQEAPAIKARLFSQKG
jgi:hypothetical protein